MESFSHWSTLLVLILWIVAVVNTDKQEICNAEGFEGRCPETSVIITTSAMYGRMRLGRCVEIDYGHLGCQNDVHHLADRWCSGRQECDIFVPNPELKTANMDCDVKGLTLYMEIDYNCVTVMKPGTDRCSLPTHVRIHGNEGHISSHVTTQTGCGSARAPWIIEVPPGQTVDMWLLDFGAHERHESTLGLGCQQSLGHIVERNLGSDFTICGNHERRKHLYNSKTNKVELTLETGNTDPIFLVHYSVIGCADLTPPAHAWYKREDSEAVIGCKSNDRVWRLYCNGNTWDGVVGNCSESKAQSGDPGPGVALPFSSVIFLTCVVCGAILLIIVVVVAGAVYVKKQSIRHEIKLRSDYACTTLQSAQYFPAKMSGYDATLKKYAHAHRVDDNQPLVQISDRTLASNSADGTMMQTCACSTVPRVHVRDSP